MQLGHDSHGDTDMRDYINIGSAPVEEQCAQVGRDNYRAMARLECRAFKEQLERKFPDGEFGIKSFPHDFGTYFEVVAYFEDEVDRDAEALRALEDTFMLCQKYPCVNKLRAREAAFEAEANTPMYWDKEAKAILNSLLQGADRPWPSLDRNP